MRWRGLRGGGRKGWGREGGEEGARGSLKLKQEVRPSARRYKKHSRGQALLPLLTGPDGGDSQGAPPLMRWGEGGREGRGKGRGGGGSGERGRQRQ